MKNRSKYTVLLVEDEPLARKRLRRLLLDHEEVVQIIGEAENGVAGLQMVNEMKPDIVFVDVEMPGMTGLEMIAALQHKPHIVFTTAFEHYAVKAFEENSVDYLLKPIEAERLSKTILRIQHLSSTDYETVKALIHKMTELKKDVQPGVISVKIGDRHILIRWNEISYLEARDKMIYVNTLDGRSLPCDLSLSVLEEMLPVEFCRIHRAYIVNTKFVTEIRNGFNSTYYLILNDVKSSKIQSSRSYLASVREKFGIGN